MPESKRTKEPWDVCWSDLISIRGEGNEEIAQINHHRREGAADAVRIVTCINALAGLSNADIATMTPLTEQHREQLHYSLSLAETAIVELSGLVDTPLMSILDVVRQAKQFVERKK